MEFPSDLKYTKEHEWIKVEGDIARIGITDYAQGALGDIVFLELPEAGDTLEAGATFGVIESVKAVSDLYAPISGEVSEAHEDIIDIPETLNDEPYGLGWLITVKMSDASQLEGLMDAEAYESYVKEIA